MTTDQFCELDKGNSKEAFWKDRRPRRRIKGLDLEVDASHVNKRILIAGWGGNKKRVQPTYWKDKEGNKVETMANKKVKGPKNKRTYKTDELWIGKSKTLGFKQMKY